MFVRKSKRITTITFLPNIVEFVQGALYGVANMISLYNRSHNISISERKKELIRKLNKN